MEITKFFPGNRSLRLTAFAYAAAWLMQMTAAMGGTPTEEKWKAAIPEANSSFGISIAASNDTIAIGSLFGGDDNGGTVHFFDPTTGEEQSVLTSPNSQAEGFFGYSLAMDEEFILIGAPLEDGVEAGEGKVYFYDRAEKEMVEIPSPVEQADAAFGNSLAMENGIAVIGCIYENGGGAQRGAAYLYDLRNRQLLRRLSDPQASDGDQFGISVATSGEVAAIGSWRKDHPEGTDNTGAVLLFKVSSGNFIREFVSPVAEDFDGPFGNFGCSLALSDSRLVVGAREERFISAENERFRRGAVYVFDPTTGEQLHRISSRNSEGDASFGSCLAMDDDLLLVGASMDAAGESSGGAIYLFDLVTGREIQQIIASDLDQNDEFGFAIAWHNDTALTGSRFEGEDPVNASGAVYRYTFGHQPDLLIGKTRQNLRGEDRYNRSGAGQQIRVRSNGRPRFFLKAQNDGSLIDQIRLRSRRNSSKFRYQVTKLGGGGNVSGAMARGRYQSAELFPGEAERFRVNVRTRGGNRRVSRETNAIRGNSVAERAKLDSVKASLQVRQ